MTSPGRDFASAMNSLRRAHRQRRMHDEHADLTRERRDADEILEHVVRQLLVEVRVRDVRGRLHHERVAVRRALRDEVGADRAGRAAAVVDHELLAELLGHLLEDDAPDDVVGAAGRENDDHAHRLRGIGLRHYVRGGKQAECERCDDARRFSLPVSSLYWIAMWPFRITSA